MSTEHVALDVISKVFVGVRLASWVSKNVAELLALIINQPVGEYPKLCVMVFEPVTNDTFDEIFPFKKVLAKAWLKLTRARSGLIASAILF